MISIHKFIYIYIYIMVKRRILKRTRRRPRRRTLIRRSKQRSKQISKSRSKHRSKKRSKKYRSKRISQKGGMEGAPPPSGGMVPSGWVGVAQSQGQGGIPKLVKDCPIFVFDLANCDFPRDQSRFRQFDHGLPQDVFRIYVNNGDTDIVTYNQVVHSENLTIYTLSANYSDPTAIEGIAGMIDSPVGDGYGGRIAASLEVSGNSGEADDIIQLIIIYKLLLALQTSGRPVNFYSIDWSGLQTIDAHGIYLVSRDKMGASSNCVPRQGITFCQHLGERILSEMMGEQAKSYSDTYNYVNAGQFAQAEYDTIVTTNTAGWSLNPHYVGHMKTFKLAGIEKEFVFFHNFLKTLFHGEEIKRDFPSLVMKVEGIIGELFYIKMAGRGQNYVTRTIKKIYQISRFMTVQSEPRPEPEPDEQ